jgi:hypothetical protein
MMIITQSTHAQESPYYSRTYLVVGWELNEMRDTNGTFLGFWAIPRTQLSVGNIRRMWIEPAEGGAWDAFAYEPVQAADKLQALVTEGMSFDSAAVFESREQRAIANLSDQDVDGGTSGLIEKGFISGDPLANTAGSMSDPTPMIDLLADVSYPVAPGLTDMMVSGTAGTSLSMSASTTQLLNNLADPNEPGTEECVCTTHTNSFFGDWVFTSIIPSPSGNAWICNYSRSYNQGVWYTGKNADCSSCDAGSEDSPAETNYVASQIREILVFTEDCNTEVN